MAPTSVISGSADTDFLLVVHSLDRTTTAEQAA